VAQLDFIEKFRDRVGTLRGFLVNANFKACANLSTDLLRASEFASYSEGLFIGEFFESLFTNIRQLETRYEIGKEDIERIQGATLPVVEFIQANMPLSSRKKKADFYDLILKARCVVTETQITYFREKPVKRSQTIGLPPPISVEEIEE
jgi:hypothetical protein